MSVPAAKLNSEQPGDISHCDLEPIHTPSLIQPHGVLIAARSSDLRIVFVSENTIDLLGLPTARVFQKTLPELLGKDIMAMLEAALRVDKRGSHQVVATSFALPTNPPLDASVHRSGDLLYLELERCAALRGEAITVFQLERTMYELSQHQDLDSLCSSIPRLVRNLTGYDRVMVYQFLADGRGQVVAEDRDPSMEPFLGLHYPASDIPRQARRLYLQKRLTMIPHIGYVPVPMLMNPELPQHEPLDMTCCHLRSVSPTHIEYQKNMGVAASLGLSVVHRNELWGLIICHHRNAKFLPPATRTMCNLLGQDISVAIGVGQRRKEDKERLEKTALLEILTEAMENDRPIADSLAGQERTLLELTGAEGVVIRHDGQMRLLGETPPVEAAAALLSALDRERPSGATMTATEEIGVLVSSFAHLAPHTCGAVLTPLRQTGDGILWLRGETVRTIRWAGHPDAAKEVSAGTLRISPRKSFAVWEQVQHGRSLAWRPAEIDAALALETKVIHQELRRLAIEHSEALEQNRQLQIKMKDDFLSHVSHELRAPLASIYSFVSLIADRLAGEITAQQQSYLKIALMNVDHLQSMIDDLLDATRAGSGRLQIELQTVAMGEAVAYAIQTLSGAAAAKSITIDSAILAVDVEGPSLVRADATRLRQILTILLDNGVKFTPSGGRVSIKTSVYEKDANLLLVEVADTGCGISPELSQRVFDRLSQGEQSGQARPGLGLGLYIAKELVRRQGGDMWVTSVLGVGTHFYFTTPRAQKGADRRQGVDRRKAP